MSQFMQHSAVGVIDDQSEVEIERNTLLDLIVNLIVRIQRVRYAVDACDLNADCRELDGLAALLEYEATSLAEIFEASEPIEVDRYTGEVRLLLRLGGRVCDSLELVLSDYVDYDLEDDVPELGDALEDDEFEDDEFEDDEVEDLELEDDALVALVDERSRLYDVD